MRCLTEQSIQNFYTYLQELNDSYSGLLDLLRTKLGALSNFDISSLDEIMKQEQVHVLQARGFDNALIQHCKELGVDGGKLSDIITALPQGEQERFIQLHKRLKTTLDEVKDLNENCQSMIQNRLHSIDRSIKDLDKSDNKTYHKPGDSQSPAVKQTGFLSKSV